jgi:hypothetical protein
MTPKLKLTYELKIIFEKEFNMTYEGDSFMCGNSHHTKWTQQWFMIIQETYLQGVFKWYNMWKYNLVFTPLEAGTKLLNDDAIKNKKDKKQITLIPYVQTIGNLMHNSVSTQLDYFHIINYLA